MNYFYITGASRGIGKAVAEKLLQNPENKVYGISRTSSISHPNYEHIKADLSNPESIAKIEFAKHPEAENIGLINNAGMLGPVTQIGKLNPAQAQKANMVNLTTPILLINKFVDSYQEQRSNKVILTTSSGAGRHTVESWSIYCATKAGIDMFSRVLQDEQNSRSRNNAFKVFAVAPGIVDTEMQTEIRGIKEDDFKDVNKFISFKENDMLVSPEEVAEKFEDILLHPANYPDVLMDLREI
jgi:benzil reductase ((S)-benzoin forming)